MLIDNYYDILRNFFREYKYVFFIGFLDLCIIGLV